MADDHGARERHPSFDRTARLAARLAGAPAAAVLLDAGGRPAAAGYAGAGEMPAGLAEAAWRGLAGLAGPLRLAEPAACLALPVRGPAGQLAGALVVWGGAPDADAAPLGELADSLAAELGLRDELGRSRRAEAELREAEAHLRLMADHIDAVLWLSDPLGTIRYVGPAYTRIWGRDPAELFDDPLRFHDAVHPDDRERVRVDMSRQREEDRLETTYRILRADGSVAWIRDRSFVVRDDAGRATGVVGIATDVTAERTALEALAAREAEYRLLFERSPQPMLIYDTASLRLLAVNDAMVAAYGYERAEMLALRVTDLHLPEDSEFIARVASQAPPSYTRLQRLWRHRRKDGSVFTVELALHWMPFAGSDACLVMATDITERQRLQEQLIQSQRLESLGRLAGGVAHDVNNVMTVISGYASFLAESLSASDPRRDDAEQILRATAHVAGLSQQLLAFARRQMSEPRTVELARLVEESAPLVRRALGERVELRLELGRAAGAVRIDPSQFEQVLLNLAINARDAMPDGGALAVATSVAARLPAGAQGDPAGFALVAVSDTGVGMSPEVQARVFEPFFTTKEMGRGTGLGLSVCHGIVRQAGGHIWVESAPGRGATFFVALPRHDADAEPPPAPQMPTVGGGAETILLVEDDPQLRGMAARALRGRGYRVLTAADGVEGLEALRAEPRVDLLVTDIAMPRMGGRRMAAEAVAIRPGLAVLYISGYAEEDDRAGAPEGELLLKPFTPLALARRVRAILDRRRR